MLETSAIAKAHYRPTAPPARHIIICGSMMFYGAMLRLRDELNRSGIPAIVPEPEDGLVTNLDSVSYERFKRKVSLGHMRRVRSGAAFGVLVVNFDKHKIADYIGPSTFAEVAMAIAFGKKVYLIGDYFAACAEELSAWGVIPLNGDLKRLIHDYKMSITPSPQKSLFETM